MLNYAGNACEAGDLVRCLPDSPKPVSPKHDSPKLGFRVRVWGYGLWLGLGLAFRRIGTEPLVIGPQTSITGTLPVYWVLLVSITACVNAITLKFIRLYHIVIYLLGRGSPSSDPTPAGPTRLNWLTNTDPNLYRPWPTIDHKHLHWLSTKRRKIHTKLVIVIHVGRLVIRPTVGQLGHVLDDRLSVG